jgi:class 3 adenylate cyclase
MSLSTDEDLKGSAVRLWHLIEERLKPGADREKVDRRIWDLFGEKWAVMFTDLAGFSRQVAAFGIIHFLQIIHEQKRLLLPVVADNDGILIKVEADSFLILFKDPKKAVRAAIAMQRASIGYNRERAPEDRVPLCVGLGYGEMLRIGDSDVFGREVNSASKLGEDRATAGEILITDAVREAIAGMPGVGFERYEGPEVAGSEVNWRLRY